MHAPVQEDNDAQTMTPLTAFTCRCVHPVIEIQVDKVPEQKCRVHASLERVCLLRKTNGKKVRRKRAPFPMIEGLKI